MRYPKSSLRCQQNETTNVNLAGSLIWMLSLAIQAILAIIFV